MVHVTFINAFEVAPEDDEEFIQAWTEVANYLCRKPGYLSHRLHRALEADRRWFINTAVWQSAEHFHAGHDAGFYELVAQPVWKRFPFYPGVFDIDVEARGDGSPGQAT